MHDYYIVLVDDCCSCFSSEPHQSTLQNIRDAYGVVTTAEELSGDLVAAAVRAVPSG